VITCGRNYNGYEEVTFYSIHEQLLYSSVLPNVDNTNLPSVEYTRKVQQYRLLVSYFNSSKQWKLNTIHHFMCHHPAALYQYFV